MATRKLGRRASRRHRYRHTRRKHRNTTRRNCIFIGVKQRKYRGGVSDTIATNKKISGAPVAEKTAVIATPYGVVSAKNFEGREPPNLRGYP